MKARFFLVIILLSFSQTQHEQTAQKHEAIANQGGTAPAPPTNTPATSNIAVENTLTAQPQADAQKANPSPKDAYLNKWRDWLHQRKTWFWPPDWSNWALTIAAIVGICVTIKTLRAIRRQALIMIQQTRVLQRQASTMERQTTATIEAAKAALLNAESVIAIERPWVDVYLIQKSLDSYDMHVTNCGRTIAKIKGWTLCPKFYDATQKLPEAKSMFDSGQSFRHSKFLPPSDSPWIAESFNLGFRVGADTLQQMKGKRTNMAYWGILQYDDVVDKPHETRFCDWFNSAIGALERVGAPEYNEHT